MENNDDQTGNEGQELLRKEGFETNGVITIWTRDETAKFLRVHPTTVSRLVKSGKLLSFKLGSRRLFKYDDVLSFFENLVDREYVFGKEQ